MGRWAALVCAFFDGFCFCAMLQAPILIMTTVQGIHLVKLRWLSQLQSSFIPFSYHQSVSVHNVVSFHIGFDMLMHIDGAYSLSPYGCI